MRGVRTQTRNQPVPVCQTRLPVRVVSVLVLGAALFLPARPGTAYRYFGAQGFRIPSAEFAYRWDEADFPLRFRLLENTLEPREWSPGFLRSVIEEAFEAWSGFATSTARVELVPEPLAGDQTGEQGIHQIGFSSTLEGFHRFAQTEIFIRRSEGIYECDIPLHPELWETYEGEARPWLLFVVMHELGHCLGLAHTEQYPMSDWVAGVPDTFWPPPLMAYSWFPFPALAEDDRVGVSLLYPTSSFTRSTGSVGGRVVLEGGPARFVYVQALQVGAQTAAGPGAFTDANGEFLLEGLAPGPVLLWMHPLLVTVANPHPRLLSGGAAASDGDAAVLDQWRWVTVTAGETLVIPDIVAASGRRSGPP